jgi:hypothetical protein
MICPSLKLVKRTDDLLKLLVLDVSVSGGGSKAGVTEQLFDGQKVNALLQQVGCETVAQGMN